MGIRTLGWGSGVWGGHQELGMGDRSLGWASEGRLT